MRKDMMVKHAELAALKKAEKPDQAAIDAKQKELKAVWDQMKEKRTAFPGGSREDLPGFGQRFRVAVRVAAWAATAWVLALARPPVVVLAPVVRPSKNLPVKLTHLLMVRGSSTGPSPFFHSCQPGGAWIIPGPRCLHSQIWPPPTVGS